MAETTAPFSGTFQDYIYSFPDFDPNSLPLDIDPNAKPSGYDELGQPIFKTKAGEVVNFTMTPPKTKSVIKEAGRAVADYLRNPTFNAEAVGTFAKDVVKGAYEPLENMATGKGTVGDLISTVGTVATPAWTVPAESGALQIFGGLKAKNPPSSTFKAAEEADMLGATAEDTWHKTGWWKDPQDKQWRFEIDDSEAELAWKDIKPEITAQKKAKGKVSINISAKDILKHDKLYEQYPDLANTKVSIETISDGAYGYFYPSSGKIALSDTLTQEQMKSTLLHEIQHAVQHKEGFASGSNVEAYKLEPAIVEIQSKIDSASNRLREAINNGESESRVRKLQENLTLNMLDYKNMQFRFYRGKSGELEARLVQHRKDMSPEERSKVSPQESTDNMTNAETKSGYEPIYNIKGNESVPKKKTSIIVPVGENWNDTAKIYEVLGRDDHTRELLTWKKGHTFSVTDPNTGTTKNVEFNSVELSPDSFTSKSTDPYPTIRTSTGEYPVILYKDENGFADFIDLSTYLGYTVGKKDTANFRFGRAQAPMVENVEEDIPLLDLPEEKGFAKGGPVTNMDKQMNTLMAEGGLKTDGATTDPVSGNEVPTGSTAEEVRDDIPAKLSDGEYVVPADVVKFFGVSFFEKLRAKAKAGLEEMNDDGRIGGEDTEDDDEELPFSVDELQTEDDSMDAQMQNAGFAKGGAVTGNPTPADIEANRSTFNPAAYPIGFSVFGNQAAAPATTAPVTQAPVATTTKVYVNKQGQTVVISFDAQGNPLTPIPAGYQPQETVAGQNRKDDLIGGSNNTATATTNGGSGIVGGGMGRIKLEDFASEDTLIASGMKDIEQLNKSKKAGGIAGGLLGGGIAGGLVGSLAGTGYQIAELRAKIQLADKYGMTKAAETLRAAEAEALQGMTSTKVIDLIASGTMLADSFYKKNPTLPSGTAATSGGGTAVKTGGTTGSTGGGGTRTGGGAAPTVKATGTATAKTGVTGTAKVGASKPVTGTAKVGGMTVTGTATTGNAKPATTTSYGGGKAKGGLMQKKTKK